MEERINKSHSIIVEDRKKFTISGIKEVLSFDEDTITLISEQGKMIIKGDKLKITNFITETGDLSGEGRVHAFAYTAQENNTGFLARLFR